MAFPKRRCSTPRIRLIAFRPRAVSAAPLVADRFDFGNVLLGHHDGTAAGMRQRMEMALSRIAPIERHAHRIGDGGTQKKSANSSVLSSSTPTRS
jgi:hypothetical protein